ncbi:MAG: DUF1294 domain-containing protein [Ruminococcaceae bacterium]|nr:DUF1294 domain-containing protein [Oscillospiraceae bacterium]
MVVYLILINAAGLLFMCLDKHLAKKHARRISERFFMLTALLGGSVGVFLGMGLFRHKTKHRLFTLGVPLILVVQVFLFFLLQ